jgi:hypothetical protein
MKTLALVAGLLALSTPALAQAVPFAPASQTAPARWNGLSVAEITGRLTAAGLTVAAPQTLNDRIYLRVDDGPLRWVMTLFSCTDGACPDVQFTAVFSGVNATPEIVSRWNGERRFVKAFHALPEEEGGEPQAVAQYDVLLSPGAGAAQLDDPIQVWRSLAIDLGRTVAAPGAETP